MAAAATLLLSIPAAAAGQKLEAKDRQEVLDSIERVLIGRAFVPGVDFSKWPDYLEKRRVEVDGTGSARGFMFAVNRILREFGVSHCRLDLNDKQSVEALAAEARLLSGVKPGSSWAGSAGLLRAQGRAAGERRPVGTLSWVDDETAVLQIRTFGSDYLRTEIEGLVDEAREGKRLVLDLRSNGGGLVNNLQHLLSLLLPPDTPVGTFVNRRTALAFESSTGGDPTDLIAIAEWSRGKLRTRSLGPKPYAGKIAVLMNRGTGSASEMAAAALRDVLGAPLVGTATAGAVLGSTYATLPHGFRLQYPAQDYVTAKGQRLEGHPLEPTVEVRIRSLGGADPVVDKAVELLKAS